MSTDDLVEYEWCVLEQVAGIRDNILPGAAFNAAAQTLSGRGLIERAHFSSWRVTPAGWKVLHAWRPPDAD